MNKTIQISDIAVLNKETYRKGELPRIVYYLDTGSLTKNKIEALQKLNVTLDKVPSRAQRKVQKNTILYSTVRPNQEHYGIIENIIDNLVVSTGFTTIDIIDKDVDPKFLYYLITQNHITEYLHSIAQNSVSSYPSISPSDIGSLNFQIPEAIEKQKQIAKVLSDLDAKIEVNNKINAELEAMAKLIYDYWFVQFDFPFDFAKGKPDINGKPYKSSGGKMVYNEELKREIPEGWEVKPLSKVIEIFDSQRIPLSKSVRETMEGDIPYYGATSIMGYVNDFIFDDDYILLAEDGSIMDDKGFPIVQFIWGKTWVNNHSHVIQAKNKQHNEFVFQLLKMIPVVLIKTGSIQMKINQENLKNHKVLIPTQDLTEKYSKKATVIRKQLINNIEQNQKLAELRDWLLPMLMNGQVTVGEVEEQVGMVAEESTDYNKY